MDNLLADPLDQLIPSLDPSDEEDFDDESSSDEEYGCRALAFDPNQLTNNNGLPVNGHDFLKLVEEERRKLPTISCAPLPKSTKQDPFKTGILQPVLKSSESEIDDISIVDSRDMNIIADQLEMNSTLPNKQIAIRLKQSTSKESSPPKPVDKYVDLAHRDEIIHNFTKLRNVIDRRRQQSLEQANDVRYEPGMAVKHQDELESESEIVANSLLNRIRTFEEKPDLTTILGMNQLEVHLTLERLADFFERTSRFLHSSFPADWVYALLAALREPIEPDICSTLRRLAKICISRRDNLLDSREQSTNMGDNDRMMMEEEELKSSLLIICIVRHYFGQSDLK